MSERWKRFVEQWLLRLIATAMFALQVSSQLTCFQVCTCRPPEVTCHVSSSNHLPTFYYLAKYNVLKIYGTPQFFQLPPGTFQQTWGVIDLTIANTNIETLRCEDFQGLQATISTLRLTKHAIKEVPKCALEKLTKLVHLYMNDCKIESLVAGDFSNKGVLATLDLAGNTITEINVRAFTSMPKLKYVNLSNNKLTRLMSQQFESLGAPSLEIIDLSNNRIDTIARNSFDGIAPSLKRLDLSNNKIAQASLDPLLSPFPTFAELNTLVMSGNPLTVIDNQEIQNIFPGLSSLSLASCSLSAFDANDYSHLRSLNVSNNDLAITDVVIDNREMLCNDSESCPDISVDVSGNKVASIYVRMDYTLSLDSVSVTAIDTDLKMVLVNITQNSTAKDALATIVLNLSNNQFLKPVQVYIEELGEDKWNSSANISLNLSDNNFQNGLNAHLKVYSSTSDSSQKYEEIDICSFTNHSIEIWELDLSGNEIPSIPTQSCVIGEVSVLKLNKNKIRRIRKLSMNGKASGFDRTRTIQLRANAIEAIDANAFDGFPNLENLDLRDNVIKTLPEMTFLKSLKSFKMLALDNNPLMCDCSMAWIQNYGVFFPVSDPPKATISGRCRNDTGYSVLCYNWGKSSCAVPSISLPEQYRLGRVCEVDDYISITYFDLSTDGQNILVKWLKIGPALLYGYSISYKSPSSQRADFLVGPASTNATLALPQGKSYNICLTAIISRTNNLQREKVYCKSITTVASPAVITLAVLLSFSTVWGVAALSLIIRYRSKVSDCSPRNRSGHGLDDTISKRYEIPNQIQSTSRISEIYDEVDAL